MTPEKKLSDALDSINGATTVLKRVRHETQEGSDGDTQIRRALSDLDSAQTFVQQALKQLKDLDFS